MKSLSDKEYQENLVFFRKHGVPEDPKFNEKRNRDTIARTIKKNEALWKKRRKEFRDSLGEKIDMVASYLKRQANGGETTIDKYLGRRWMAKLRGEQIVSQLRDKLMVRGVGGEVVRRPGEVFDVAKGKRVIANPQRVVRKVRATIKNKK